MTSTETVTVIVRAGLAGKHAEARVAPGPRPSWHRRALCSGVDTGLFFPDDELRPVDRQHRERVAKAICAACPVRRPCAMHAVIHGELHGVWGGLSEADRRFRAAQTDSADHSHGRTI